MNYKDYTDKYFLRSKEILEKCNINPLVRYQVFVREGGPMDYGCIEEAVDFIKGVVGNKVKIFALLDGSWCTSPCESVMTLEGRVQDKIDLETIYLGIISNGFTGNVDLRAVRKDAIEMVKAAEGKPVLYMGARHFHYNLDVSISQICKDAGFAGCSTDVGAKVWGNEGMGTMPHALILAVAIHLKEKEGAFGNKLESNPTVVAGKIFDGFVDRKVERIVLIDTFNKEISDSIEVAREVKNLYGVRIDTCGENYVEGYGSDIDMELLGPEYRGIKGVSIDGVWRLKKALIDNGFGKVKVVVSSGFNAKKIKVFIEADKLFRDKYGIPMFDIIGTGSVGSPVMATSDIVAYFSEKENRWVPFSKVGRGETASEGLVEVK